MSSGRRAVALRPGQLLAVGGMLFSMFFGAGNLILPPLLGLQAGDQAIPAMTGFLIAGIGLPVLGIVAVAVCGGVRELAGRVSPLFASVFIALMYLTIGPFLAIPRTSSTAFEMLRPLLPVTDAAGLGVATAAFSVAFFGVAFALALRPGLLSRVLGRFSAPALILLIVLVVGASVLGGAPAPTAPQPPYDASPLSNGFLTGYQTMDLLAALCFGIVVAANVRELGVSDPKRVAGSISGAGLIAGALMMAIYCGLAFVGWRWARRCPTRPTALPSSRRRPARISARRVRSSWRPSSCWPASTCMHGAHLVLLGVLLRGFSAYPASGVGGGAFAAFSCAVSLVGLDAILAFSAPLLGALYPPAIVLVVMGLAHGRCDRLPRMWPCAVLATAAFSVAVGLRDAFAPGAWLPLDALPLADAGLGWIAVAIAGAAAGAMWSLAERRRRTRRA